MEQRQRHGNNRFRRANGAARRRDNNAAGIPADFADRGGEPDLEIAGEMARDRVVSGQNPEGTIALNLLRRLVLLIQPRDADLLLPAALNPSTYEVAARSVSLDTGIPAIKSAKLCSGA